MSWMKEPYGEGVATHTGPKSCVGTRKGSGEALTGVRIGWVLSREMRFVAVRRLSGMPTPTLIAFSLVMGELRCFDVDVH